MYTYIKSFPHVAIKRWQQLSNFAVGVQKWLGRTSFCAPKVIQEINFPK